LSAFGWDTHVVDGHDVQGLFDILAESNQTSQPRAIVANTIKGKGVSFMEGLAAWHHKVPSAEQVDQAIVELTGVRS